MHITVPGMYSMDHSARLILDTDIMTKVNADDYKIAAASNANGVAGNPQTGDHTNILLYVLLLIGSGTLLAYMLKRRLA